MGSERSNSADCNVFSMTSNGPQLGFIFAFGNKCFSSVLKVVAGVGVGHSAIRLPAKNRTSRTPDGERKRPHTKKNHSLEFVTGWKPIPRKNDGLGYSVITWSGGFPERAS
jgi:hypothetical protein